MANLLFRLKRRVLSDLRWMTARRACSVVMRWYKRPALTPSDKVCLFVTYSRRPQLKPDCFRQARLWRDRGYKFILIAIADDPDAFIHDAEREAQFDGFAVRPNQGYDFGAWAGAICDLPEVREVSLLVTVNDSIVGPLRPLDDFLDRVDRTQGDLVGVTESREARRHYQSYMLFFRRKALQSDVFNRFWRGVRVAQRTDVVVNCELRLLQRFEQHGLEAGVIFPAVDSTCPTNRHYRRLLDEGFPYVKRQLLRDRAFRKSQDLLARSAD